MRGTGPRGVRGPESRTHLKERIVSAVAHCIAQLLRYALPSGVLCASRHARIVSTLLRSSRLPGRHAIWSMAILRMKVPVPTKHSQQSRIAIYARDRGDARAATAQQ